MKTQPEKNPSRVLDKLEKCSSIHVVKRNQMLTAPEVVDLLKKKQGKRTAREFAEQELGISESYLSNVYRGKSDPGELILCKIGLSRRVLYEKTA
jgi:hypothetical protein